MNTNFDYKPFDYIEEEHPELISLFDGKALAEAVFNHACVIADSNAYSCNGDMTDILASWIDTISFARFIMDGKQFISQLLLWSEVLHGEPIDSSTISVPEDYRELYVLINKAYDDFSVRISELITNMEDKDND